MKLAEQLKDPWYRANRDRISAQRKAKYAANPEPMRQRAKDYRAANLDLVRKQAEEYRKSHRRKLSAKQSARYYANHELHLKKHAERRERKRQQQRAFARMKSATVSDQYVREQLAKYSPLSMKDFPQSLVEAKRLHIQLKRITHERKAA